VTSAAKHALRALLVACACALLLPLPAPAASRALAATPCWKTLMNEWYSGRITHLYPLHCYRDAINQLPADVTQYSSAIADIERARQLAVAHAKNPNTSVTVKSTSLGTTGPKGTTKPKGTTGTKGRTIPPGPLPTAINDSSPGGATSFPLPLIILGGLAIFLLAAGGVGLIIRRMQGRGPGTP
jgi:Alphavirus glycoprotein J